MPDEEERQGGEHNAGPDPKDSVSPDAAQPTEAEPESEQQAATQGVAAEPEETDTLADENGDHRDQGARLPRATFETLASALGFGELVVSFRDRDVRLSLDGPTAMRVMAHWARGGRWDDTLTGTSGYRSAWVVIQMEDVIAMSWSPGVIAERRPVAFDPPPLSNLAAQVST